MKSVAEYLVLTFRCDMHLKSHMDTSTYHVALKALESKTWCIRSLHFALCWSKLLAAQSCGELELFIFLLHFLFGLMLEFIANTLLSFVATYFCQSLPNCLNKPQHSSY